MNKEVKAIILCNNPVSIPGIKEFLFYGKVGAIVVTKRNKEMQHIVTALVGESGVPVIMVTKKDYQEKIKTAISSLDINVALMMTFPYIIPEDICKLPGRGFINFHYGLLPQCRGPQPILWHLLNNDAEAGVTVHKVDGGIDTGEIILQEKIKIEESDTYGMLQSRLAWLAAKPAANLLKILSFGSLIPSVPQDETKAVYRQAPVAADLTINWKGMTAARIQRLVNACNPWNKGAGAAVKDWFIGITEVEPAGNYEGNDIAPGTILSCNPQTGLIVNSVDGKKLKINIIYLQEGFLSGWKLAGFGICEGDTFS